MLWLKIYRPELAEMFPDDPALDYHNLEGVHNGGEAMTIFPLIKDMPPCRARSCT